TVNIKSIGADLEVADGERLPLAVKELGTYDLYPQNLRHNPNGRLIFRIDVNVKNLYWADSGDLVTIASDTLFYILKYNHDVVASHIDSGKPVDEEGVEDAFELLHEMNERVRTDI
ncbi:hypothetical protein RYX36_022416, partial [Vicia faba]